MYGFLERTVSQYMASPVVSVGRDLALSELESLFARHDFNAFPVTDGGCLVGLVTKFDFLKAFAFTTRQLVPHYDELMHRTVGDVMTEAVVAVEPHEKLSRVLQHMLELRARSFPVTEEGRLVGMISREDLMRALKQTVAA